MTLELLANVGRPARTGPWDAVAGSTGRAVVQAAEAGHRDRAVELFDYWAGREAEPVVAVYLGWVPDLLAWLGQRLGPSLEQVALESVRADAGNSAKAAVATLASLVSNRVPRGDPRWAAALEEAAGLGEWRQTADHACREARAALSGGAAGVAAAVERAVAVYRDVHDAYADWTWALLTAVQRHVGEVFVGDAITDTVGQAVIKARTSLDVLAAMTPEEVALLTAESMRAHFSGPDRMGDVEIAEEPDRYVLSFDPCGSGGRMRREADDDGRHGAAVEAYPWTWGQKGVCLYCAHCSVVNEIIPMQAIGRPKRVTEYPRQPGDKCRWLIYKDPADIPDEFYQRVGVAPPPADVRRSRRPKEARDD
jgi:hypothetical protein